MFFSCYFDQILILRRKKNIVTVILLRKSHQLLHNRFIHLENRTKQVLVKQITMESLFNLINCRLNRFIHKSTNIIHKFNRNNAFKTFKYTNLMTHFVFDSNKIKCKRQCLAIYFFSSFFIFKWKLFHFKFSQSNPISCDDGIKENYAELLGKPKLSI